MELIQMSQSPCGTEQLVAILSMIVGITTVFVLIVGMCESNKTQILAGVLGIILTILGVTYCAKTPDLNVYTYKMNNPTELAQMLNSGWTVDNQHGVLYDLIKK